MTDCRLGVLCVCVFCSGVKVTVTSWSWEDAGEGAVRFCVQFCALHCCLLSRRYEIAILHPAVASSMSVRCSLPRGGRFGLTLFAFRLFHRSLTLKVEFPRVFRLPCMGGLRTMVHFRYTTNFFFRNET